MPRTKLKPVKHQKNNRLFILVKITTNEIKEFKEERNAQTVYTGPLLTQELHPVSQKPLGNPLGNQIQITYTYHQRSDLDPLKKHTSFGSAHTPRMLILTTSRAHNSLERIKLLQNQLKSIQSNHIPLLS